MIIFYVNLDVLKIFLEEHDKLKKIYNYIYNN